MELRDSRLLSWAGDDLALRLWSAEGRLLQLLEGQPMALAECWS